MALTMEQRLLLSSIGTVDSNGLFTKTERVKLKWGWLNLNVGVTFWWNTSSGGHGFKLSL